MPRKWTICLESTTHPLKFISWTLLILKHVYGIIVAIAQTADKKLVLKIPSIMETQNENKKYTRKVDQYSFLDTLPL